MADSDFTPEELATEEWRCVADCDGKYSVSNLGRVRSNARVVLGVDRKPHRFRCIIMKTRDMKGYTQVLLWLGRKVAGRLVHRLVAHAFIGDILPGLTVNHLDGCKTNNRAKNLEIVTYRENTAHAMRTGLAPRGQRMGNARLTDGQALAIFRRRLSGERSKDLAAEFGIARPTVAHLVTGRNWNHVTGLPRLRSPRKLG